MNSGKTPTPHPSPPPLPPSFEGEQGEDHSKLQRLCFRQYKVNTKIIATQISSSRQCIFDPSKPQANHADCSRQCRCKIPLLLLLFFLFCFCFCFCFCFVFVFFVFVFVFVFVFCFLFFVLVFVLFLFCFCCFVFLRRFSPDHLNLAEISRFTIK